MSQTDTNVIIGAATLYVDGVDIGHLQDGVRIRLERDYKDIESQQRYGLVRKARILERFIVVTSALEATLTNLKKVWDQGTTAAGTVLLLGGNGDENEHELVIVGSGPGGATRTVTLHRAVSISTGEMPMDRTTESVIPLEFECLKSTAHVDGNGDPLFGSIVDA